MRATTSEMYQLIDGNLDAIHHIRHQQNTLVFSSLRAFDHPIQSAGFAIKYVTEGTEHYTLNGRQYPVGRHQYLLLNQTCDGRVSIESKQPVVGLCINLMPELLAEIVASQCRPDTAFSDVTLGAFFSSHLFLENYYNAHQTHLGQLLLQLSQNGKLQETTFDSAFFYSLSERIIADQRPIFKQLQGIPSVKAATKKDLYKRLARGREFIDAAFRQPLLIEDIAREACMSEYHFFRLFRQVFGCSPNQYLIQKRLEHGLRLLQADRQSVSAAASESGFSDIHAFSKAFKRQFGYAPSETNKR